MVWVIASIVKIPTQPQAYITEMGCCVHALTRVLPGVFKNPLQFCVNISKTVARHTLSYIISMYICRENFRPWSLKVRSPGQVKWPHYIKSFNVCQRYTEWPNALKLSEMQMHKSDKMQKMYVLEFWYRWHKVRSILRPLQIASYLQRASSLLRVYFSPEGLLYRGRPLYRGPPL